MKNTVTIAINSIAIVLVTRRWSRSAPLRSGGAPVRVVFGALQERGADYSGSVSLSNGKLVRVAPWRFFGGDAVQGLTNGSSPSSEWSWKRSPTSRDRSRAGAGSGSGARRRDPWQAYKDLGDYVYVSHSTPSG